MKKTWAELKPYEQEELFAGVGGAVMMGATMGLAVGLLASSIVLAVTPLDTPWSILAVRCGILTAACVFVCGLIGSSMGFQEEGKRIDSGFYDEPMNRTGVRRRIAKIQQDMAAIDVVSRKSK